MKFFNEIVGLRAWLALWVAVGHGLELSGFLRRTNPVLKFLLDGHAAVVVFMIVSGFVITNLILTKQEGYPQYITRRFFRLFPAYFVCCVFGFLLAAPWLTVVRDVPWQDAAGWADYSRSIFELNDEVKNNFLPHLLLHLTMLHGLVPVEILNRSAMTFVPAAWSISLEWQFYLIAPLVIGSLGRAWRLFAVVATAFVILFLYKHGTLGTYQIAASIAGATPYFAFGIASRLAFEPLSRLKVSPVLAAAVGVFIAYSLLSEPLQIVVWVAFFSFLLWHRQAPFLGPVFRLLTTSKPLLLLGEASYSLYLVHRLVQVALAWASLDLVTMTPWTMLAIQMVAIVVAIPLSLVLYTYVERPGIRIGSMLAKALPGGKATRPERPPVAV
ncbi:MAG TPA: acyltransferase [Rhizobiaceae bacterium]|nr:acyltransferase [Rhizobiaceae bacterium]